MATLTVGHDQQYATLAAAVASAAVGDTIDVQAGTYVNDFPGYINGLTIEGVGGQAVFVANNGASPPNGKAPFDVLGNTTLRNLDISGVSVSAGNGAGIRYESGNLLVQNCSLHDDQNGLLAAGDLNGSITIDHSEFYNNGTSAGNTHNIYVGDVQQFTIQDSYVHDANVGHEIKSRAENTTITNNRIFDNQGTSSYSIDLPNGGNTTISGNVIEQGPNGQNGVIIAYGEEGSLHAGTSVSFTGDTVVNDLSSSSPYLFWDYAKVPISASGDTLYGLTSSQLDRAGTLPSASPGYTYATLRPTLDTSSSPLLTVRLATDTGLSSTDYLTSKSDLTGTADPNTVVTVQITRLDGTSVSSATTNASATGQWTVPSSVSVDGSYIGVVSQTDAAGNTDLAKIRFTLDTVAPNAPTITGTGGPTNQAVQVITGTAEASSTVSLYDNGTPLGTVAAGVDGSWSKSITLTGPGGNALTATATDQAGNIGLGSAPLTYTLDMVAPNAPTITGTGGPTNQAVQVITGTAEASSTVTLSDNGTPLGTVAAAVDGSWSKSITLLVQGPNALTATATNQAGTSAASPALSYTLDPVAPNAPTIANKGGVTNQATQVVSGSAEANSFVSLADNGTVLTTTVADSSGNWSKTVSLPVQGTNRLVATATDAAGNISPNSNTVSYNLDTIAPVPVIQTIAKNANGTVTLNGVSEANSNVSISDAQGGSAATSVGTTTTSGSGSWRFTTVAPIKLTTVNIYTGSSNDLAGNTGTTMGKFVVSSTGSDTLTGTTGQSDVFAFLPSFGKDVITGFEQFAKFGATHDVIDLSGSKYTSFSLLSSHITYGSNSASIAIDRSNSITLTGFDTTKPLQASDFRFS